MRNISPEALEKDLRSARGVADDDGGGAGCGGGGAPSRGEFPGRD